MAQDQEHQQPERQELDVESLKSSVNSLNNLLLGLQGYISFMESAGASQQQDIAYLGPMKELVSRASDVANNIYNNMRGLPPGQRLLYPARPPATPGGVSPHPLGLSESVLTPPRDYHGPLQTTAPPPPHRDRHGMGSPHNHQAHGTPPPEAAPNIAVPQRDDLSKKPARVPPQVTSIPAAPRIPAPRTPPAPTQAPPPTRISAPSQASQPAAPPAGMPAVPPAPPQQPPAQPQPPSHPPASAPPQQVSPATGGYSSPAEIPALANLEVINREGTRGLVMLVDDEEHLLYIASRMLANEGFSVINCEEVFEAISIFEKVGKYVDLVILDFSMPTMNGEDVFYELADIDPSVRIVLSSGIFEQEVISRLLKKGLKAFLPKPYKKESLLQTVTAAIGKR